MDDREIKQMGDIGNLKDLRDQAEQLESFRRTWPVLKPFGKLLGFDVAGMDRTLDEVLKLEQQLEALRALPGRFEALFFDRGWVLVESVELQVVQRAVDVAEGGGLDEAEGFLADHFTPAWVEAHLCSLQDLPGFGGRFDRAAMALNDYRAGRFHTSVLMTLTLIDGWVRELYTLDSQGSPGGVEGGESLAWDVIGALPAGLANLDRVAGEPPPRASAEEMTALPDGGRDDGADAEEYKKRVAAKCWAALFAVGEWVTRAEDEDDPPPQLELAIERAVTRSIEGIRETPAGTGGLEGWRPREVVVGESVPAFGEPEDYPAGTPERTVVDFLNRWQEGDREAMARCYAPLVRASPADVRIRFEQDGPIGFELLEVREVTPAVADVRVALELDADDDPSRATYEFRLVASDGEGQLASPTGDDVSWGLAMHRVLDEP